MKTNNNDYLEGKTKKEWLASKTDKEWNDYINSWDPGDSGKLINEYRARYLDAHIAYLK